MKVPVLSSLILSLGLASQSPAIERPKSLDDAEGKKQPVENKAERVQEPEAIPQVNQELPWLGVLSEPVTETLGVHLGVESGVVLSYVAAGSPAAKAGLEKHDVLTKVDGREVANQEELRGEIQSHRAGEEVTLSVVNKGKTVDRKVVLGARPADLPAAPRGGDALPKAGDRVPFEDLKMFERLPDLKGLKGLEGLEKLLPEGGEDLRKHLDGQMKRLEEQLRDLEKRGGFKLDLNLDDMLEDLPKPDKGGLNFNFKASSSFKFFDGEGSVEMNMKDGGKEVVVKDKAGKVLFEGPWDTPQDKASAPEDIRNRIERMNDGNKFHFRLENMPEPDLELPEPKDEQLE